MKQFGPDYDYRFWFWRHKLPMVVELFALLIDYDFMEGEFEGLELELEAAKNNAAHLNEWAGGLYYGKKDVIYLKMAQEIENRDIIHVFVASSKILKERIEFINLIQEHYKWFQK
jgi:hypothetical protein